MTDWRKYDEQAIQKRTEQREGRKAVIYLDSKNILTYGVGHALGSKPVPEHLLPAVRELLATPGLLDRPFVNPVLDVQFLHDLADADKDLEVLAGVKGVDLSALSGAQQEALLDMMFNMGSDRLGGFVKMWTALAAKDWQSVATEAIDSTWFREGGERAREDVRMLGVTP